MLFHELPTSSLSQVCVLSGIPQKKLGFACEIFLAELLG